MDDTGQEEVRGLEVKWRRRTRGGGTVGEPRMCIFNQDQSYQIPIVSNDVSRPRFVCLFGRGGPFSRNPCTYND